MIFVQCYLQNLKKNIIIMYMSFNSTNRINNVFSITNEMQNTLINKQDKIISISYPLSLSSNNILSIDLSNYTKLEDLTSAIANLIDSSPSTLDTLKELSAAINNDSNFSTTVITLISQKQDKILTISYPLSLSDNILSIDLSNYPTNMQINNIVNTLQTKITANSDLTIKSISIYNDADIKVISLSSTGIFYNNVIVPNINANNLQNYYTKILADQRYQLASNMVDYYNKNETDNKYQLQTSMIDYYNKNACDSQYQLKTSMVDYYNKSDTDITFQKISTMSDYLTTATASSTYQRISNMSSYLTTTAATITYQTLINMATYLTVANASATYQRISNMSSYLTTAYNPFHCAGKINANATIAYSNGKYSFLCATSGTGIYTITFFTNYASSSYVINAVANTPSYISIDGIVTSASFTVYVRNPSTLALVNNAFSSVYFKINLTSFE